MSLTMPDPYTLAIVIAFSSASLAALGAQRGKAPNAVDAAIWLLLWIPFDLRWFNAMWPGRTHALSYGVWSLYVSAIGAIGWARMRRWEGLGRVRPRWRDLAHAAIALGGMLALVVPLGLAIGFLRWNPQPLSPVEGLLRFGLIGLTIALPEELYFRGVLQSMLERRLGRPQIALVLASLAFGLMHWNNTTQLSEALSYCGLASVAGVFYGLAFRWGKSLWPAILCHTAVDWVWAAFLHA